MPYSTSMFDNIILDFIKRINISTFLDIGPGAGKYGNIVSRVNPGIKKIGVEIEPDYIERFKLNNLYDEVLCMPAIDLIEKRLEDKYDLVIIGDCIEHMYKSTGIDLINFLMYRVKYLVVIYPDRYIQDAWGGYKHEAHISVWGENDFRDFDKIMLKANDMNLMAANGFLLGKEDPKVQDLFKEIVDLISAQSKL